jgi:hypothetical protein
MRFRFKFFASIFFEELAGYPLLQNLQDFRGIALGRFRYQEMNVFRHRDIPDQPESVSFANFIKDSHKTIARQCGSKERAAVDTTGGDEVKIVVSVASFEWVAHRKPAPLKPARVRHPIFFGYPKNRAKIIPQEGRLFLKQMGWISFPLGFWNCI